MFEPSVISSYYFLHFFFIHDFELKLIFRFVIEYYRDECMENVFVIHIVSQYENNRFELLLNQILN